MRQATSSLSVLGPLDLTWEASTFNEVAESAFGKLLGHVRERATRRLWQRVPTPREAVEVLVGGVDLDKLLPNHCHGICRLL